MPGYSGTPLAKKLGIKPGFRVSLLGTPTEVRDELKEALAHCKIVVGSFIGKIDFIMWFAKSKEDLEELDFVSSCLAPAGMLWVSWPRRHPVSPPT